MEAPRIDADATASSVARRLSALTSFYRFAAARDLRVDDPSPGCAGPRWTRATPAPVGLTRDEARALVVAVVADPGPQRERSAALALLLLLQSGLRVDEPVTVDFADLGTRPGNRTGRPSQRVLRIVRKGGRAAIVALAPATVEILKSHLAAARATTAEGDRTRLAEPPLATRTGGRRTQRAVWCAGPPPHACRRGRDVGRAIPELAAATRDVQDLAGTATRAPRDTVAATPWSAPRPTASRTGSRDRSHDAIRTLMHQATLRVGKLTPLHALGGWT